MSSSSSSSPPAPPPASSSRRAEDSLKCPNIINSNHVQQHDEIHIHDNVLTVQDCRELIAIHESERHMGYIDRLTITRFADLATPHAIHLTLPMIRARHLCLEIVEVSFGKQLELYPEFTALMAWHPGSYLKTHYDANREYLQDRHYSAILYLNDPTYDPSDGVERERHEFDGFSGGDLVMEVPSTTDDAGEESRLSSGKERLRVSPKAGRLVCFPSNHRYPHRVEEITAGTRYTLTLWFTQNEDAMETLDSCRLLQSNGPLEVALMCQASERSVKNDDYDQESKSSRNKRLKCSPIPASSSSWLVEQPWETPDQAKALLHNTMVRANLVCDDARTKSCIFPASSNPSCVKDDDNDNNHHTPYPGLSIHEEAVRRLSSITTLIHILAYCQNQQGRFLLTREDLFDGDDESTLVKGWRHFVQRRLVGLQSASKRWSMNGIITNVTDQELSMD